uniref:Uncharacterized protein n=1 Tax=Lactuca sativa TaxID=4236 RepID=A0A9R1ULK5_LACSA|nr:hypothetical protein LSAT_V11C800435570 [Lactuca sativa]
MSLLSNLVNLLYLDLERCPLIHGGLVYQSLRCLTLTNAIALLMMIWNLSQLKNLKELEVSSSKVTDHGCFVPLDAGLNNLESLNLDSFRIQDNGLINLAADSFVSFNSFITLDSITTS